MIRFLPSFALIAVGLIAGSVRAQEIVDVIHVGDSITFGLGDSGVVCFEPETASGYPPHLKASLAESGWNVQPLNEGLCGESTFGAVNRIGTVLEEHPAARLVLLMEGTNDITAQVSIETIRQNLQAIAAKADEKGLETVYGSVIPRGPGTSPDSNNIRTFSLGRKLAETAEAEGRFFADAFGRLDAVPDLFSSYYSDDYHPNSSGYELLADAWDVPTILALESLAPIEPCVATEENLCLGEERFKVEIDWVDPDGVEGRGQAVPLTEDTGEFWFFNEANIEVIVKIVDARCYNDSFWVFYGALSDVEYEITVTDTVRGTRRTYQNPYKTFASNGHTDAFHVPDETEGACGGNAGTAVSADSSRQLGARSRRATSAAAPPKLTAREGEGPDTSPCVDDAVTLCLNEGRFEVRIDWTDFDGLTGTGQAFPQTDDTGTFWFFNEKNLEVVVKVLDARPLNGAFWVFYGALSNVEYRLTVRDTETGALATYDNPSGTFASNGDTDAFPQDSAP